MKKPFDDLTQMLRNQFPSAQVEVENFVSGAAQLLVRFEQKIWTVEFLPAEGFGASLLSGDESDWLSGHAHIFATSKALALWLQNEMASQSSLSLAA